MTLSFRIFLLYSFVLLGRPQDVWTFLQPFRPVLVVMVLAVIALAFGARDQNLFVSLSRTESKRYWLFYLFMIFGVPFAVHRGLAFEGAVEIYIVNMVFFVLLTSHITSLQKLKSLIWIACLSTLMYSFFGGVLQLDSFGGGRFRSIGNVLDPNDTAFILVSLFPLSIYFVRVNEGLVKRLVGILVICSSVAIILTTESRGGILALGSVLLLVLLTRSGGIGKVHKLIILAMLAATWLLIRDQVDMTRYLTLLNLSSDYNVEAKGGRLDLWTAAIELAFHNPLTGVGVNCFSYAYFLAGQAAGSSYRVFHTVHNSFLQVAAEVGLVGFGIFVLITLKSLSTFVRISRVKWQPALPETRQLSALSGLMFLGFTGLMVSGFFLSQGYSGLFTFYFGLAACIARLNGDAVGESSDGRLSRSRSGAVREARNVGTIRPEPRSEF